MATTKIWDVSAHVSKLLTYVANKNKTTMEIQNGFDDEEMRLAAEALGLSSDHFMWLNCPKNQMVIFPHCFCQRSSGEKRPMKSSAQKE